MTADAGPTPYDPQPPDRRSAPRRHEEAALHYAEQNLIGAALAAADAADDNRGARAVDALRQLSVAAAAFRFAEALLTAENRRRAAQRANSR